jgi:hypothetical protein
MKRSIVFVMLIGFMHTLQAQCPEQLNGWERVLTGSSYTWSWRVLGDPVKWGDGSTIPNSTLLSYVNSALSQWQNAANSQGTVITLTYTSDYENADIVIQFLDRGPGSCGNTTITTTPKAISINSSQEAHWSYNGTGIDLHTTILHEVGHLFVNAGRTLNQHIYPDDNSVMRLSSCTFQDSLAQVVQRTLGACDASLTLNYYNPKIPVTIKNNFGNSDGGTVKIDGVNQNSPYTQNG